MLCGDLLFSGHTLVMVTCSLAIAYYLPKRWTLLQWIPHTATCFGLLCMIISRTHYTIDILIAYWLTGFVFRLVIKVTKIENFDHKILSRSLNEVKKSSQRR